MLFADEQKAVRYLNNISYQRLVPYIYPFYKYPKADLQLKPNTTFEKVLSLYRFDKKLRMLLFNEIEKIEVSIRCVMANSGCQQLHDDYWISAPNHYADEERFKETLKIIRKELKDSKEDILVHFRDTYAEAFPPGIDDYRSFIFR